MKSPVRLALALSLFFLNLGLTPQARAQTWATNGPMNVARWQHSATLLTNGDVLIAGGLIFNDGTYGYLINTNSAEIYSPVTGNCSFTTSMQDYRHQHTATLLPNGQVLVAGGGGDATSEIYDPASGNWSGFVSMNDERQAHTATLLPNGQVLVAAGYDDSTGLDLSSAELYDPASQSWTNTGEMPYATDTAAAVLLTNGTVLVCGGSDGNGSSVANAAIYIPASHSWTNIPPMNTARVGHSATVLTNGTVLVAGGADDSAEIYDPVAGSWSYAGNLNDDLGTSTMAVPLNNGQVLLAGGGFPNTDVEVYDVQHDQWSYNAPLPVPGNYQTITVLSSGQVLVTGGSQSQYNGPAVPTVQTYSGNSPQIGHILVAHYPFNTSTTNPLDPAFLADTSGNSNDLQGPYSQASDYPAVTTNSIAGRTAVQFHGDDYYSLPSSLLTTIAGTYSISLWLKTTQVSGSDTDPAYSSPSFVWAGGVGDPYFDSEPMTLTGHKLGFYTGDDNATLHSVSNIDSGNFTHIVITRDQPTGVKKIYINGALDSTATNTTVFLIDSPNMELGVSDYNGGVAGIIDDVQFYDGLLTAAQVSNLFANPGSVVPDTDIITLASAIDDTNQVWSTSGNALWFGENDFVHDGTGAAQSGSMTDNQSSVLQTTVIGPGTLTFWWQVLCANDNFSLAFQIDSTTEATLSGQHLWTNQTYLVGAGAHTLTWTAHSNTGSLPTDAGYVDQVTFNPQVAPSPGMWTLTNPLTNGVESQTATLLPNGKVLVVGGTDNQGNVFSNATIYDPNSGTWAATAPLHTARYLHTATLLTNGLVLISGGSTNPNDSTAAFGGAELYNPSNATWSVTGSMHTKRYSHSATLLPNGTVLVAGGQGTNLYPNPNITNGAEIYNPNTGLWTATNSMAVARYNHTATLLPNGTVLVAGGEVTNFTLVTSSCEIFDPTSGSWSSTGFLPNPVANHTATLLPDGTVLVAGGDINIGSLGGESLVAIPYAQFYNQSSRAWTAVASMFSAHDSHTATLLTSGAVLIAGGQGGGSATNSAELYVPFTQSWIRAAAMNAPRRFHTATLLGNGLVLAVGGYGNNFQVLSNAELYSPVAAPPIFLTGMAKLPGGAFQFNFTNTAGAGSTVFETTNVGTPFSNWTSLGSAIEISAGHFQFTDSTATNKQRFYRVRSP